MRKRKWKRKRKFNRKGKNRSKIRHNRGPGEIIDHGRERSSGKRSSAKTKTREQKDIQEEGQEQRWKEGKELIKVLY